MLSAVLNIYTTHPPERMISLGGEHMIIITCGYFTSSMLPKIRILAHRNQSSYHGCV